MIRPDINVWKPASEVSIIDTDNDPLATTILANIGIQTPVGDGAHLFFNNIAWRAGRRSIVRDMAFLRIGWLEKPIASEFRLIKITGNGGGKWYAIGSDEWGERFTGHTDYRHLLVEGTSEPLSFYSLNIERSLSQPQAEFRNARNVTVYHLKSEHNQTALLINHSKNIQVFGYGGNASPLAGRPIFAVHDSDDVYIANVCPTNRDPKTVPYGSSSTIDPGGGINTDPALCYVIQEDYFGASKNLPKIYNLSLFKRGKTEPGGGSEK
jgi:hypothetical protein